jgi:hypothetical protein
VSRAPAPEVEDHPATPERARLCEPWSRRGQARHRLTKPPGSRIVTGLGLRPPAPRAGGRRGEAGRNAPETVCSRDLRLPTSPRLIVPAVPPPPCAMGPPPPESLGHTKRRIFAQTRHRAGDALAFDQTRGHSLWAANGVRAPPVPVRELRQQFRQASLDRRDAATERGREAEEASPDLKGKGAGLRPRR